MNASDIEQQLAAAATCLGQRDLSGGERHLRAVLSADPAHVAALCQLAQIVAHHGQTDEAVKLLQQAMVAAPGQAQPAIFLGDLWLSIGQPANAETVLSKVVTADPDNAQLHFLLGTALERTGRVDEAVTAYLNSVRCGPDRPEPHMALGRITANQGDSATALDHFKRWVALSPNDPAAHCELGGLLVSRWEFDAADACYDAALKLVADHPVPIAGKVTVRVRQRQFDEAWQLLTPFVERGALPPELVGSYAGLSHHYDKQQHACELIEQTVASEHKLSPSALRALHHQAGDLYDRLEQYDQAFSHYRRGNGLNPDGRSHPKGLADLVDRLIATFNPDALEQMAQADHEDRRPVFIVGMPRSGTTLMEQVIASHPDAFGAGELWEISQLVDALPAALGGAYPECLASAGRHELRKLAGIYLKTLRRLGEGATRVTDKMPHNFMHLGVIDRLFPGARVIHCVRHPVDTCLSCYIQPFAGSGYTSNLTHLGQYYRQYERLMAHWASVLSVPILTVRYEDMVADQEGTTRKVLDFIDLPWDDRTLQFHKTRRKVATASYDQATRPIYTRSVARWRHYEAHLGPLFEALGFTPPEG